MRLLGGRSLTKLTSFVGLKQLLTEVRTSPPHFTTPLTLLFLRSAIL